MASVRGLAKQKRTMQKQQIINLIRKEVPNQIANELACVQPMDEAGKALSHLVEMLKDGGVLTITSKRDPVDNGRENE